MIKNILFLKSRVPLGKPVRSELLNDGWAGIEFIDSYLASESGKGALARLSLPRESPKEIKKQLDHFYQLVSVGGRRLEKNADWVSIKNAVFSLVPIYIKQKVALLKCVKILNKLRETKEAQEIVGEWLNNFVMNVDNLKDLKIASQFYKFFIFLKSICGIEFSEFLIKAEDYANTLMNSQNKDVVLMAYFLFQDLNGIGMAEAATIECTKKLEALLQ